MRLGRRIGIDVGDVRIGVAVSDPEGRLATDLETIAAGPDAVSRLVELIGEHDAIECIVGLPLSLSGRQGPAARKVRSVAERPGAETIGGPGRTADERMISGD